MTSRFALQFSTRAVLVATLVTVAASFTGCSGNMTSTGSALQAISVAGNWQFSSKAPSASHLSSISGELKGTTAAITGILHADSASACVAPNAAFAVTGATNSSNVVTLTAANVAGGTFTFTGTLAADGKSISNASYTVAGGACSFTAPADASGQSYASITGTYTGNFTDQYGDPNPVSVTVTQTPDSDTDGNFSMNGSGTFPQNACFNSPASVTNAQVTGGSFSMTYTDPTTQNSVTGSGSFAADASTLTLTGWQINGPCGNYSFSISGTLTRQ